MGLSFPTKCAGVKIKNNSSDFQRTRSWIAVDAREDVARGTVHEYDPAVEIDSS
jgi:hypothetical protein